MTLMSRTQQRRRTISPQAHQILVTCVNYCKAHFITVSHMTVVLYHIVEAQLILMNNVAAREITGLYR